LTYSTFGAAPRQEAIPGRQRENQQKSKNKKTFGHLAKVRTTFRLSFESIIASMNYFKALVCGIHKPGVVAAISSDLHNFEFLRRLFGQILVEFGSTPLNLLLLAHSDQFLLP
jgi:hypothetical protein